MNEQRVLVRRTLAVTVLLYMTRLSFGALLALPLWSALNSVPLRDQIRGDALLFDAGGVYLVETLRLAKGALLAALPVSAWLLAIQAALSILPVATVFHALARRDEPVRQAFHRGVDSVGRFLLLAGINFLVQAAVVLIGLTCAISARRFVAGDSGAPNGEIALVIVMTLTMALCCTVGAMTDLVRAASVLAPVSPSEALYHAFRGARQRAAFLPFLYLGLNGLCIAAAAAAGFLVGGLHVERGESYRWFLGAAAHQGVIFLICWGEAYFRQSALRTVQAVQQAPLTLSAVADTAFDSGARLDPS